MSHKLNIAVLNSGHFHAGIFLNELSKLGHKITAISCENRATLEKQAKILGAKHYVDYKKLLENETNIDFVICCGMHYETADMLDMVISKNIPFCTEKPITGITGRMKNIVKEVEHKALFSDVALPLRFSPIILAFEEFKNKNHIGEIVHCYFRNMAGGIERYRKWGCGWMLEKTKALGGAFMNEGAHYIDLFRYLTGEEIKNVQAAMSSNIYHESIDDNFSAIFETHSRKRAVIEICYGYPTNNNWRDLAVVINTENYLFTLIDQENPRVFKLEARSRKDNSSKIINLLTYEQNVYAVYLKEMFKRFLSGKDGVVPVSNFLGTQVAISKAYISAERNNKGVF